MKRILLLAILFFVFFLVEIATWLCFLLDEIFFPGWRKTAVKAPVFIVGLPRTGSTFFHNLICYDKVHFTSMKYWEILLAPSIIQKMLVRMMFKFDKRINRSLSRMLRRIDKLLFKQYEPIHITSFFNFEEDDYLLLHMFSALILIFPFPRLKYLNSLVRFDEALSGRKKNILILFYSCCIRKHLYFSGQEKIYVSKSPAHSAKMESLILAFPDCRFIYMLRNPEATIPSCISMFANFCKIYGTRVDRPRLNARAFAMADYWYQHPLVIFNSLAVNRYFLVVYDDLIRNARSTVVSMYAHFGVEYYKELEDFLKIQSSVAFRSAHHYTPEKFGLTVEEIKLRYQNVYEEYLHRARSGYNTGKPLPFSMVENG